ncbi:hypothetical protein BO71DRAFT_396194 [Aspergillus ellipticus CBS 707.79]|uniref:Uncharacterized protein n=1 Tax=Aspergillus ellipticus CBS 707.79 TaxID=1448320 RepID=A0A319DJ25_9EURO|nr:hypothetical protein BO71DRAFT_396194 [Aspergillus ellipticus CBS 707.79]
MLDFYAVFLPSYAYASGPGNIWAGSKERRAREQYNCLLSHSIYKSTCNAWIAILTSVTLKGL